MDKRAKPSGSAGLRATASVTFVRRLTARGWQSVPPYWLAALLALFCGIATLTAAAKAAAWDWRRWLCLAASVGLLSASAALFSSAFRRPSGS